MTSSSKIIVSTYDSSLGKSCCVRFQEINRADFHIGTRTTENPNAANSTISSNNAYPVVTTTCSASSPKACVRRCALRQIFLRKYAALAAYAGGQSNRPLQH